MMALFFQLLWSTANEDLVELFETTGQVELAEILFDGTRSKGAGVVQFAQVAEAETAIGMSFPLPLVLFTSMTKRALQRSSSSMYMVGGPRRSVQRSLAHVYADGC